MKLVSLNICGLMDLIKQQQIRKYLNEHKIDVLLLQETNMTETNKASINLNINNYTLFNNLGINRGAGVLTICSNFFPSTFIQIIISPGYISALTFKVENKAYVIVNAYIPNEQNLAKDKIRELNTYLTSIPKETIIILGGDFNCTLQPWLDRSTGVEHHFPAASKLENLIRTFDLKDAYRVKNPNTQIFSKYTKDVNGAIRHASRIDQIYISIHALENLNDFSYIPVVFSDHFSMHLAFNLTYNKTAYWIFNNNLLRSPSFNRQIKELWLDWKTRKVLFPSIGDWWEIGKAKIKSFILSHFSVPKYANGNLTKEYTYIGQLLPTNPQLYSYFMSLQNRIKSEQLKFSIEEIAQAQVKNFSIGSIPSKIFFKSIVERKKSVEIEYIEQNNVLLSGKNLDNFLRVHYEGLFSDDLNTIENQDYLLDIPKISEDDFEYLESPFTLDEIKLSIKTLSRNTSPGMDGLTSEFYLHFINLFSDDLMEVFQSGTNFPNSWTTQIIKLLPKTGNKHNINNWRPISLCNVDYKIVTKTLANRLKMTIGSVVNCEQSYCIPQRTIHDNIIVAKFMYDHHNKHNLPLAMVSLDQSKAFDNVSHSYLFKTLQKFNFPPTFIRFIQKLYSNSSIIIKHQGKLLSPVPFKKGIRQGCPLSGMLYSLIIETFLHNLKKDLNNFKIELPFTGQTFTALAYADDILLLVNKNEAFPVINNSLISYSNISGAKINLTKSQGLWCGSWTDRVDTPLINNWTNSNIKYLGLNIGQTDTSLNDNAILLKITRALNCWKLKILSMSLRGRVLLLNYLVSSSVYHILKVYAPHFSILKAAQDKILSAFWSGRRWMAENILYPSMNDGGLGLSNLIGKSKSFQLNNFRKVFMCKSSSVSKLLQPLFTSNQPGSSINYFFIQPKPPFPIYWTESVTDLALKWAKIRPYFEIDPTQIPFSSFSAIPLWRNPDVRDLATGEMLSLPLFEFTCAVFGDVVDRFGDSRIPIVDLGSRMLSDTVRALCVNLDSASENSASAGLVLKDNKKTNFENINTKTFYDLVLSIEKPPVFQWKVKWNQHMQFDFENVKINTKNFYAHPTSSIDADIAYRLLNHSLPHPNQTSHFSPNNTRNCNVCFSNDGTLYHRFFTCPALIKIIEKAKNIIENIKPDFPMNSINYLLGPKSRTKDNALINFVLTSMKSIVHQFFTDSRRVHTNNIEIAQNTIKRLFISKIKQRIRNEFLGRPAMGFYIIWGPLVARSDNNDIEFLF